MESLIYKKLADGRVQCGVCHHFCRIEDGEKGLCAVRENQGGRLVSLVYPKLAAKGIDPIEKKPIFHLNPGSLSYSIATAGCNLKCAFCQNADLAQINWRLDPQGRVTKPKTIVAEAIAAGCDSISYTYSEPTVFVELALEIAEIAKSNGLKNVFVTNGFMSDRTLDRMLSLMDAANVDLKAFDDNFYQQHCNARLEPVKQNIIKMKQAGVVVEVTTLLIPGLNDKPAELESLAEWLVDKTGPDTPWHISRFHPCHHMTDRGVTPLSSLKTAHEIGKAAGIRYVYVGNVPAGGFENTYCHSCNALLVERTGFNAHPLMKQGGMCPACGKKCYGQYDKGVSST